MTDNKNNPTISDARMDQLLSSFYESEMPKALDQLPSSWPQLNTTDAKETVRPVVRTVATSETVGKSAANRGLAVIATLAACMMIFLVSDFGGSESDPGIPVSNGDNTSMSIDDVNTTLQEIEGIDLAPETKEDNASDKDKAANENR